MRIPRGNGVNLPLLNVRISRLADLAVLDQQGRPLRHRAEALNFLFNAECIRDLVPASGAA